MMASKWSSFKAKKTQAHKIRESRHTMHSGQKNGSSNHQDNPFAERVDDLTYHSEAIREKRLNLILHLASYSAVLLIQGEEGSGKTTFMNRLRERAQSNWVVCRINGGPGFDRSMLYHALFRVFTSGIPLEDGDHPDESLALLMRELAALRHEHRIPVLIIDDADHLPDTALETLDELLVMDGGDEDLLSIILSAEPGFEARLVESSLQTFKNRISHVFDLPAFNQQDTSEYIHLRLSAAGIEEGNPFTPSAMHLIHTSSRGIPGRINTLAQQILAKEKKPQRHDEAPKTITPAPVKVEARVIKANPKRSRNWGKIALGAVLIPLLGLLFFQDSINRWLEQTPAPKTASSPSLMPAKPAEIAAAPPQPAPQDSINRRLEQTPAPKTASSPSLMPAKPAEIAAAPPQPAPIEHNLPPAHPLAKPEYAAETNTAAPQSSEPIETSTNSEPPAVKREPPVTITTTRPPSTAPTATPTQTETPPTAIAIVERDTEVAPVSSDAATAMQANDQALLEAPPAVNSDERWLMSRQEGHYTLQLLVMSPEGAKRFVTRQSLGGELHSFARPRNGKKLIVLIYGDYATKAEARAASKTLTTQIKTLKPWIRSMASVKNDFRS